MENYLIIYEDSFYGDVYEDFIGTFSQALDHAKKDGRRFQIKVWSEDREYPMYVDVNDQGYLVGEGRVSID